MSESTEPLTLWMNARTLAESQAILQAHPDLLSDESYSQIESFAAIAMTESPELVPTFFCLTAVAGAARRDGIGSAYARIEELMASARELAGYREQLVGNPEPSQIPVLERALQLGDEIGLSKPLRIRSRLAFACLDKLEFRRAASLYRDCIEHREGLTPADTSDLKYFLAVALSGLAPQLAERDEVAARVESVKWLLESGEPPLISSLQRSVELVARLHFRERDWKRAESLYSMALERFETLYSTYTPMSREGVAGFVVGLPACLAYASIRGGSSDCGFRASRALEHGRLRAQSLVHHREELLLAAADILPKDLHERLQQACIRLGKTERGGLIANTLQNVQRATDSQDYRRALWDQQIEDADRLKEQVDATENYERLCGEIEKLYPGVLKSRDSRQMPEAGELLGSAEGLAYLAHTDMGTVAILWARKGVNGDVVARAWADEELDTAAVQACLTRRVKTFWKWKEKGLLPAQSGQGSLPVEVEAAIKALDRPHGALSEMARACRTFGLKRLVLVPCGFFALLPLHAAPVYPNAGGPAMPLADVVRISHAHSVETWVLSRMRARRRAAKGAPHALVVSDPKPVPVNFSPLLNAEEEARFVAELVDRLEGGQSMTLRDEAATCSSVVRVVNQSVPPVTHIHFACHAVADVRQPKQSGLILSNGEVLTVFDLADPARSPVATLRLAVLAACQTAVVGTDLVDEAIGLSAAWVQMGAATVVASLWPISDGATLAIMKKFYQLHLIDGLPPSDALWLAQRWLRGVPGWREDFEEAGAAYSSRQPDAQQERLRSKSSFARPWDHPVYWAAFVVYGD